MHPNEEMINGKERLGVEDRKARQRPRQNTVVGKTTRCDGRIGHRGIFTVEKKEEKSRVKIQKTRHNRVGQDMIQWKKKRR